MPLRGQRRTREIPVETRELQKDNKVNDNNKDDDDDDEGGTTLEIFGFDDLSPQDRQHVQEIQVLVALYDTTGGSNHWDDDDGWLEDGAIPCEWKGVVCNNDQYITALHLQNNNLVGTLPASMLWDLQHLTHLDLSRNPDLTVDLATRVSLLMTSSLAAMAIPTVIVSNDTDAATAQEEFFVWDDDDFGNNNNSSNHSAPLRHLNVSDTATKSLEGIAHIRDTLQELDLSHTLVSATSVSSSSSIITRSNPNSTTLIVTFSLSDQLRQLSHLRILGMNHLSLGDQLDNYIPFLSPNLQHWHARNASFMGTIPTSIGLLSNLETLNWSHNQLQGSLPTIMNAMTTLTQLELQGQERLAGPLLSFHLMPHMRHLDLSDNRFTRDIPTNLLASIGNNTTLPIYVNLKGNLLDGAVPETLVRLDNLYLDVTDNYLSQLPPALCQQTNWMNGAVGLFGCDAILCPPGLYNEYGRRTARNTPCEPCDFMIDALFWGSTSCRDEPPTIILAGAEANITQRDILNEFFVATGGAVWNNRTGWQDDDGTNTNVCNWFGVDCAGGDTVQELILHDNNLQGTSTANLFQLPSLQKLDLSSNPNLSLDLSGLATVSDPVPLRDLIVSNTSTSSLEGISRASNLEQLVISNTQITGPSLFEIYSLSNLRTLNMGNNNFNQFFMSIGSLTNLVSLRAPNAGLVGTIPSEMGALTNLVSLDLAENFLVGPLPETLNHLQSLRIFDLRGQKLPFGGPLLPLDGMVSLMYLDLSSNALTGPIPTTFLNGITDKYRSIDINLRDNQLTGSLPLELALFQSMHLDVTENRIEHIPEILCIKQDWMDGLVSDFGCDAIMCPPGMFNEQGRVVAADGPCETCPNVTLNYFGAVACPSNTVAVANSDLTSAETLSPDNFVALTERGILELLFQVTGGSTTWIRTDKWMDNATDICGWYGVNCDADNQVRSLVLSENGLQGTTPPQLFQLSRLERLFLNGNSDLNVDLSWIGSFQAQATFLDSKFGQESVLRALVIAGTATTSVSGISKATSLQALNLNSTKVTGEAMEELMGLSSLQSLNIGNTRMNRDLPTTIGGLTNILELSVPNAGITGTIPNSIGRLTGLALLDLSGNRMIGSLPPSLEDLVDIRVLDIHDQGLANGGGLGGNLLPFEKLFSLTKMDLSQNRLSGQIPDSFLSGIFDKSAAMSVNLRRNSLTGSIPGSLSSFAELNIDVTANSISHLPESLCSQQLWMDGNAESFGCDAILCPPGTYNSNGRQVSALDPCEPCPIDPKPFYGSNSCFDFTEELDGATTICPSGLACYNHGKCVEAVSEPGVYTCDCRGSSEFGIPFEGLACEYKATDLCHDTSGFFSTNITSFCTNNGLCRQRVPPGNAHKGCICNSELWKGDYCELRNAFVAPSPTQSPIVSAPNSTQTCPDGIICENGSACMESTYNQGSYGCDCDAPGPEYIPSAGDRCQYVATSLCSVTTPYTSFCVNGGACVALVDDGVEHMDCLCPGGFSGGHCEIEAPSMPVNDAVAPPSDEGGMEGWQMALVFILPAMAILIIFVMILAAYSRVRKKDLKSVNADLLAESEYNKYASEDPGTPVDSGKEDENTDFETPPSIIDRALASIPDEEQTGFFSLPETPREIEIMEDEPAPDAGQVAYTEHNIEPAEEPEFDTRESAIADGAEKVEEEEEMPEVESSVLDELPAVIEESESQVLQEDKSFDVLDDPEVDYAATIPVSFGQVSEHRVESAREPEPEKAIDDKFENEIVSRSLPGNESFGAKSGASDECQPDAWVSKPRVAFDLPSDDDFNDEDDESNNFIGDIHDQAASGGATGKSLFSGVQGDDSVSFLDQSVGLSEDSERSERSLGTPTNQVEVSVEPSLAQTMFGGRESMSDNSSGDLSLNF
ncbi:LRR receptor-like serine threonine-protein kinase [Seminavis robusta]|uniref:LRR receptor-like serine threonine-protein kinase n=1 Tax=Seminavis robusta TaxID=568900 RepID=A0A9N8ESL5_9STRA|nr:LRR receptor-like serine threonine-protein kinase [Seminavis robusta]|eukprot:Sro1478_g276050.1 LRR receptor-like serine threonine-protein kinase (1889) ;mRNA; r:16752-22418